MKLGQRRIDKIFQECLDAILGGGDLEQVLKQYPKQANALSKRLEAALWLMENKVVLVPRPGFVQASRQRLMGRLNQASSSEVTRPRDPHALKAYRLRRFWLALNFVSIAVLVLVLGFVGTQTYSFAKTALPGDMLYPVKLWSEKARLETAFDPATQARLHVDFARLRSSEIVELIFEGRFNHLMATSMNLQYHVRQANQLLKSLKSSDPSLANSLSKQLETTFTTQDLILDLLIQSVPQEARGGVKEAMISMAR